MTTTQATSYYAPKTFDQSDIDKALNLAKIAIWQFCFKTKEITAHENLYEILGFPQDAYVVNLYDFKTLIHPEDKLRVFKALEKHELEKNTDSLELQFRMRTADNQWKWIRNKSALEIDGFGQRVKWLGSLMEITKLKESENLVRKKNQHLNAVVNSLTDIIYEIDENFTFINCWVQSQSEHSEQIESFVGKKISSVFSRRVTKRFETLVRNTINSGEAQQIEYHARKADKYYFARTTLIEDSQTVCKRVTMIIQDVTTFNKTRLQLSQNEANLNAMIQNTSDVFWALDTTKKLILFNQAFEDLYYGISGLKPKIGELLSQKMLLEETAKRWEAIHERSLQGMDTKFSKHVYFTNGDILVYEFHINPLKDKTGKIIGSVVSGRDINEIYKSKKQAEKAARLKSKFVSTISHEIRTPLNAILGTCHQLLKNNQQDNLQDDLNILNLASENLLSLITDVLDFTKLESGKSVVHVSQFNFKEFINAIVQFNKNLAFEKNLQFNIDFCENLPELVLFDRTKLHQILSNLLSNAIKYTQEGSITFKIKILKTNYKKCTIGFTVYDTGIGIPKVEIDTIFDSFTQSSTSTKLLKGGTGLGLAITKNLVDLLNGKIEASSNLDNGTTFNLSLDFEIANSKKCANKILEKNTRDLEGIRILVAEDNEINAKIITRLLHQWNAKCDLAVNGQIAIDLAKTNDYDIILMDIQMPLKNGFEASGEIKEFYSTKKKAIPVVALTAQPDFSFDPSYKEGMFEGYILKPFHPDLLKENILEYTSKA